MASKGVVEMGAQNIVVISAGIVVAAVIVVALWIRSRGARQGMSAPASTFLGLENRAANPPPRRPAERLVVPNATAPVARPVDAPSAAASPPAPAPAQAPTLEPAAASAPAAVSAPAAAGVADRSRRGKPAARSSPRAKRPVEPRAEKQVALPAEPQGDKQIALPVEPRAEEQLARPVNPQAEPQVARPVEPVAAPQADLPATLRPDDDLALIKECVEENSKRATALQVPAIFHEVYRNIRTWTTSLAPGRYRPEIVSETEIVSGHPTTYRFTLKKRAYSIVKTDLTDHSQEGKPLVHENVRLADADGSLLFEMALVTTDYRSEEQPGEIAAFVEGSWVDDFKELNDLVHRDSKRIGDDFRKKFRAKEAERLKRDFGV